MSRTAEIEAIKSSIAATVNEARGQRDFTNKTGISQEFEEEEEEEEDDDDDEETIGNY